MTAIPVDKDGNLLLEQVMTWMDARSTREAEYILGHIGARKRYERRATASTSRCTPLPSCCG